MNHDMLDSDLLSAAIPLPYLSVVRSPASQGVDVIETVDETLHFGDIMLVVC